MLPLPRMRTAMRSKTVGHFFASCIAGLGRLWHCTQYRTMRRAPRDFGAGSFSALERRRENALEHRPVRAFRPALPRLRRLVFGALGERRRREIMAAKRGGKTHRGDYTEALRAVRT